MNRNESLNDELALLEAQYKNSRLEQSPSEIDKSIIAMAHRELDEVLIKNKKLSGEGTLGIKRFLLPLYAMSTLSASVLAVYLIIPEQERVHPIVKEEKQAVRIQIEANNKITLPKRKQIEVPEIEALLIEPESPTENVQQSLNVSKPVLTEPVDIKQGDNQLLVSNIQEINQTEYQDLKSISDPDEWARDILKLYKSGFNEKAKLELILFKKAYPNYPIEEMVKSVR